MSPSWTSACRAVGGIDIARKLSAEGSKTAVILYTGHSERSLLLEALDAGARGFLVKEAPLDDLARAIRTICDGGTYVDPALAGVLAGPQAAERLPTLTKREREVLRLLADGMRNEQVARRALDLAADRPYAREERDAEARGGHPHGSGGESPPRVADRLKRGFHPAKGGSRTSGKPDGVKWQPAAMVSAWPISVPARASCGRATRS